MKKFRKTQCPYCGRKIGVIRAWILKTQGEYRCPKCGGISNIELDSAIYLLAVFAAVLSAVFFLLHYLLVRNFSWMSLILVAAPFILFFLLSPFLVRLRKPVIRRRPPTQPQEQRPPVNSQGRETENKESNNMEHTIVMDYFKKL